MLLAGNYISYAGPFSDISPLCAAAIARSLEEDKQSKSDVGAEASASSPTPPTNDTGTGPVTKTVLLFEVDCPDAMNVSPLWVNYHDSTSLGTPSSALPGSSYTKAVEAKATASSLSGGNFRRSVFVTGYAGAWRIHLLHRLPRDIVLIAVFSRLCVTSNEVKTSLSLLTLLLSVRANLPLSLEDQRLMGMIN